MLTAEQLHEGLRFTIRGLPAVKRGTSEGDDFLIHLLHAAGVHQEAPPWPNYCGYTVQALFREVGFNHNLTLASAGKVLHMYAKYAPTMWAVYENKVWTVKDLHDHLGSLRKRKDRIEDFAEGDILVHVTEGWHGHVMYCAGWDGEYLRVVAGNDRHTSLDGIIRPVVGWRRIHLTAAREYIRAAVTPSVVDFAGVPYFRSEEDAVTALKEAQQ